MFGQYDLGGKEPPPVPTGYTFPASPSEHETGGRGHDSRFRHQDQYDRLNDGTEGFAGAARAGVSGLHGDDGDRETQTINMMDPEEKKQLKETLEAATEELNTIGADYEKAEELLTRAVQFDGTLSSVWLLRSLARFEFGSKILTQVMDKQEMIDSGFLFRDDELEDLEDKRAWGHHCIASSLEDANKCLELAPNNPYAFMRKSVCLFFMADLNQSSKADYILSEQVLQEALEKHAFDDNLHVLMMITKYRLARWKLEKSNKLSAVSSSAVPIAQDHKSWRGYMEDCVRYSRLAMQNANDYRTAQQGMACMFRSLLELSYANTRNPLRETVKYVRAVRVRVHMIGSISKVERISFIFCNKSQDIYPPPTGEMPPGEPHMLLLDQDEYISRIEGRRVVGLGGYIESIKFYLGHVRLRKGERPTDTFGKPLDQNEETSVFDYMASEGCHIIGIHWDEILKDPGAIDVDAVGYKRNEDTNKYIIQERLPTGSDFSLERTDYPATDSLLTLMMGDEHNTTNYLSEQKKVAEEIAELQSGEVPIFTTEHDMRTRALEDQASLSNMPCELAPGLRLDEVAQHFRESAQGQTSKEVVVEIRADELQNWKGPTEQEADEDLSVTMKLASPNRRLADVRADVLMEDVNCSVVIKYLPPNSKAARQGQLRVGQRIVSIRETWIRSLGDLRRAVVQREPQQRPGQRPPQDDVLLVTQSTLPNIPKAALESDILAHRDEGQFAGEYAGPAEISTDDAKRLDPVLGFEEDMTITRLQVAGSVVQHGHKIRDLGDLRRVIALPSIGGDNPTYLVTVEKSYTLSASVLAELLKADAFNATDSRLTVVAARPWTMAFRFHKERTFSESLGAAVQGFVIAAVVRGGPGERMGLRKGMRLQSIDGFELREPEDVDRAFLHVSFEYVQTGMRIHLTPQGCDPPGASYTGEVVDKTEEGVKIKWNDARLNGPPPSSGIFFSSPSGRERFETKEWWDESANPRLQGHFSLSRLPFDSARAGMKVRMVPEAEGCVSGRDIFTGVITQRTMMAVRRDDTIEMSWDSPDDGGPPLEYDVGDTSLVSRAWWDGTADNPGGRPVLHFPFEIIVQDQPLYQRLGQKGSMKAGKGLPRLGPDGNLYTLKEWEAQRTIAMHWSHEDWVHGKPAPWAPTKMIGPDGRAHTEEEWQQKEADKWKGKEHLKQSERDKWSRGNWTKAAFSWPGRFGKGLPRKADLEHALDELLSRPAGTMVDDSNSSDAKVVQGVVCRPTPSWFADHHYRVRSVTLRKGITVSSVNGNKIYSWGDWEEQLDKIGPSGGMYGGDAPAAKVKVGLLDSDWDPVKAFYGSPDIALDEDDPRCRTALLPDVHDMVPSIQGMLRDLLDTTEERLAGQRRAQGHDGSWTPQGTSRRPSIAQTTTPRRSAHADSQDFSPPIALGSPLSDPGRRDRLADEQLDQFSDLQRVAHELLQASQDDHDPDDQFEDVQALKGEFQSYLVSQNVHDMLSFGDHSLHETRRAETDRDREKMFDESQFWYESAASTARLQTSVAKLRDPTSNTRLDSLTSESYCKLGQCYSQMGVAHHEEAKAAFHQAKQISSIDDSKATHMLASLLFQQHDFDAAAEEHQRHREFEKDTGKLEREAAALTNLAFVQYAKQEYPSCYENLRQAGDLWTRTRYWTGVVYILNTLAQCHSQSYELQSLSLAIQELSDALSYLPDLYDSTILKYPYDPDMRTRFLKMAQTTYRAISETLFRTNFRKEAIMWSEAGKSRICTDKLATLMHNPLHDDVEGYKFAEVIRYAKKKNCTVIGLYYMMFESGPTADQVVTWVVPSGTESGPGSKVTARVCDSPPEKLWWDAAAFYEQAAEEVRASCVPSGPGFLERRFGGGDDDDFEEDGYPHASTEDTLARLYDHLLAGVMSDVTDSSIVIIPHGRLQSIPWSALLMPRGAADGAGCSAAPMIGEPERMHLCEAFSVSVSHSVSQLLYMDAMKSAPHRVQQRKRRVGGHPGAPGSEPALNVAALYDVTLPYAEDEAKAATGGEIGAKMREANEMGMTKIAACARGAPAVHLRLRRCDAAPVTLQEAVVDPAGAQGGGTLSCRQPLRRTATTYAEHVMALPPGVTAAAAQPETGSDLRPARVPPLPSPNQPRGWLHAAQPLYAVLPIGGKPVLYADREGFYRALWEKPGDDRAAVYVLCGDTKAGQPGLAGRSYVFADMERRGLAFKVQSRRRQIEEYLKSDKFARGCTELLRRGGAIVAAASEDGELDGSVRGLAPDSQLIGIEQEVRIRRDGEWRGERVGWELSGLTVLRVEPRSPAHAAGVRPGWRIRAIAGQRASAVRGDRDLGGWVHEKVAAAGAQFDVSLDPAAPRRAGEVSVGPPLGLRGGASGPSAVFCDGQLGIPVADIAERLDLSACDCVMLHTDGQPRDCVAVEEEYRLHRTEVASFTPWGCMSIARQLMAADPGLPMGHAADPSAPDAEGASALRNRAGALHVVMNAWPMPHLCDPPRRVNDDGEALTFREWRARYGRDSVHRWALARPASAAALRQRDDEERREAYAERMCKLRLRQTRIAESFWRHMRHAADAGAVRGPAEALRQAQLEALKEARGDAHHGEQPEKAHWLSWAGWVCIQ